jgi:hypothetical protein
MEGRGGEAGEGGKECDWDTWSFSSSVVSQLEGSFVVKHEKHDDVHTVHE